MSSSGNRTSDPTWTRDDWLSACLEKAAYRLAVPLGASAAHLGDALQRDLQAFEEPVFFAFAKVPMYELGSRTALADAGFRLIETSLQFSRRGGSSFQKDERIRLATPGDRAEVAEVAARSFVFTRFHQDPLVPHPAADRIKREWAENYFTGTRGDSMLVAEVNGQVAGFCLLLHRDDGARVIDLIAVDPDHRRLGLGAALCNGSEQELGDCKELVVGTQACNTPSVRMYERVGFRFISAGYVFHFHGGSQ